MNTGELVAWVRDARERTIELVTDLTDEQLMGPKLAVINPFLWEIGHVAWFQEKWVLRGAAGQRPLRADGDSLYDSAAIPHDTRWDLPLDRKSTRLNSSHANISYAVFCLKKKNAPPRPRRHQQNGQSRPPPVAAAERQ